MKNRFRTVAALALLIAGLAGACAGESKPGMMSDKQMSSDKGTMAMDKPMAKTCKCGMTCDTNGKCSHCDAEMPAH